MSDLRKRPVRPGPEFLKLLQTCAFSSADNLNMTTRCPCESSFGLDGPGKDNTVARPAHRCRGKHELRTPAQACRSPQSSPRRIGADQPTHGRRREAGRTYAVRSIRTLRPPHGHECLVPPTTTRSDLERHRHHGLTTDTATTPPPGLQLRTPKPSTRRPCTATRCPGPLPIHQGRCLATSGPSLTGYSSGDTCREGWPQFGPAKPRTLQLGPTR